MHKLNNESCPIKEDKLAQQIWDDPALTEALKSLPTTNTVTSNKSYAKYWVSGVAASFILLVIVSFTQFTPVTGQTELNKHLSNQYKTQRAERQAIALADGSNIHLNADTQLSVVLSESMRQVSLSKGEAYFDVAHNANRPFKIQSFYGQVEVLGTAFNLEQSSRGLSVSVYEGRVRLSNSDGDELILLGGQKAEVDISGTIGPKVLFNTTESTDWQQGLLNANDMPLGQIVERLSRYSVKPLYLAPGLSQRKVTGSFALNEVNTTIGLIGELYDLEVIVNDDNVYLRPK
ncbi:FecR family protein [Agaribacter marinus]|uniref:FecR protein domain-containing protein n=1 Tax=Agaribacter marinus TaxID=1431249 RepID=A0AA37SZX7_9ALTE|nr:FecR domain-containing protein [Agaribacter marinus]GLR71684.1 hypothetical protein GCM10007852_25920 [Agaribacter marinus]